MKQRLSTVLIFLAGLLPAVQVVLSPVHAEATLRDASASKAQSMLGNWVDDGFDFDISIWEPALLRMPTVQDSARAQSVTATTQTSASQDAQETSGSSGVNAQAPASASSTLPPTAPTVLKPGQTSGAFPPLPGPMPQVTQNINSGVPTNGLPGTQSKMTPSSGETLPSRGGGSSKEARTILPAGPLSSAPLGAPGLPGDLRISGLGGSSVPWSIVVLLTLLTLIPSVLICLTPFARLLVVFHFLRQALGLQTTPSNQTLIGLTMILTFFIMEPVGKQIYRQSFLPLQNGEITVFQAVARGEDPMRTFMVHFVREKDAALFLEIAKEPRPHDIRDLSMRVLLPAYIVSELKAGFQIGAVLFLPFLVVDMVVASITTSVGMMQLPPVVISTPLKLLLFLMVDGWHLLIGALMRSFT